MKLETRTEHIHQIRLAGDFNNNKMERVMRTTEKSDTSILTGMQTLHNYIRPHQALKGKTPTEVAGIIAEGDNEWPTLIQKAAIKPRIQE